MASWQRIAERNETRVEELEEVLKDLLRCGDFFYSAIELDNYIDNPIDGETFESRIKELIN